MAKLNFVTVENFKGIAEPVTVPIRPITLLFGKNSAGKSTLVQALHYSREVLVTGNPDPDRTRLGADIVDLGGFQNLVHGHDLARRVRVRVGVTLDDDGIPNAGITGLLGMKEEWDYHLRKEKESTQISRITEVTEPTLDLNSVLPLESAWIEVITAWEPGHGAYISEYAVALNGEELVRLRQLYGLVPELLGVNFDHPLMIEVSKQQDEDDPNAFRKRMALLYEDFEGNDPPRQFSTPIQLSEYSSIIPDPHQPFPVNEDFNPATFIFWSVVGQALTGSLAVLITELNGIRYVGPIRDVPPRGYRSPKTPDPARWAHGAGAWDALIRNPALVEPTSRILNDVLDLGYTIRREERIPLDLDGEIMAAIRLVATRYEERDAGYFQKMILEPLEALPTVPVLQLHDEKSDIDVDPPDIGVGVAQILPVVVGLIDPGPPENPCGLFAVEQPELHVHPAVQCALGDVFIEATHKTDRVLLIESHSEHLLLRLLRRVRERSTSAADPQTRNLDADSLSVVYVQPVDGAVQLTPLSVTDAGDFLDPWPEGFFDERDAELF